MSARIPSTTELRDAIERARRSKFYAHHLAAVPADAVDDLARLPVTTKVHLRDAGTFGMLAVPPSKAWHYHESSGTTGEPISTWCGLDELRLMADDVCRMVPELEADTILLNRFPLFAPVAFVFEEALRMAGACHIAAGNLSWDVPFGRVVEFIQKLGVTALAALPFEPILLREVALMQGLDLKRDLGTLKVIFAGGAVLPPAMRRVIESDWGARIVEIYGSNETMLMGVGCTHGKLHLCEDLLHFEVLDPETHATLGPGQPGVLTVTSLVHQVMPLVRYVTGDLVRILPEPCACGSSGSVAEVFGRVDEGIRIGGNSTSASDILDAAYDFADRHRTRTFFVVVLKRRLHMLIEVDDPGTARDPDGEAALAKRVGVPIRVEYLGVNEVMDRTALFRGPKIYKPSQISDWRGAGRRPVTIMEALLEWPKFDGRTLYNLVRRQIRSARRRGRLARELE